MSDILATKKKGESFESLFRRFSRRVQSSGKIMTKRSKRYFERNPGSNKTQESALRRLTIKEKLDYKLRAGKLTEDELRGMRRRRR